MSIDSQKKPIIPYEAPTLSRTGRKANKIPPIGVSNILDRSKLVAEAFGPYLGFTLMMTAILATTGVSATTLFFVVKLFERLLS